MKILSVSRYFLLAFLFLLITPKLFAQQNQVDKEKISGDVYFRLGPSGIPVYPRGAGRNEHWTTGINLKLEYKKLEFYFSPAVVGAATFDNPDRFEFEGGISYKLPRKFSLRAILYDQYALNNIPPVDPQARRPTSSVNSLWLGGLWDFEKYKNKISIFARYGLRSNEPVLFTHFTKPYARWHIGTNSEIRLTDKIFFIFEPEIYFGNRLRISQAILNFGVERRLRDGKFVIGGYYTSHRNLFIPQNTVDYRDIPLRRAADRLFFGVRIPFSSR